MIRDQALRIAAIGLILYGLLGFALIGLGYVLARETFDQIEALQASLIAQRAALVGTLRGAERALSESTGTFDNFGTTLGQARQSSEQAAALARETSQTMTEMGRTMGIQIFGLQPLGPLAGGFFQASDQMVRLGADLDATGSALGRNVRDVSTVRRSIEEMRGHVASLARAFESTPVLGGPTTALRPFKLAVFGLLIWLGCQAFVSILLGIGLFRHATIRIRASFEAARALSPPERVTRELARTGD